MTDRTFDEWWETAYDPEGRAEPADRAFARMVWAEAVAAATERAAKVASEAVGDLCRGVTDQNIEAVIDLPRRIRNG